MIGSKTRIDDELFLKPILEEFSSEVPLFAQKSPPLWRQTLTSLSPLAHPPEPRIRFKFLVVHLQERVPSRLNLINSGELSSGFSSRRRRPSPKGSDTDGFPDAGFRLRIRFSGA